MLKGKIGSLLPKSIAVQVSEFVSSLNGKPASRFSNRPTMQCSFTNLCFILADQKKKPFTHVKENSSEHKSSPIRYTGTLFSPVYHCYGSHTLEDGENNNTVLETDDSDSTASSKFLG